LKTAQTAPDIEAAQVLSSRDEEDPEATMEPKQTPQVTVSAVLVGPKHNKAVKSQNDPAEGVVLAQATRVNLWNSLHCECRVPLLIGVVLVLAAGLVVLLVVSKNKNSKNNSNKVEGEGGPPGITNYPTPSPVFFDNVKCGKIALKQVNYCGTLAIPVSGKTCQEWDAQFSHPH
jgi:hypothetical protein